MWGLTLWLALLASLLLLWQPRLHERSTAGSFALHFLMALPFFALAGLFIINDTSYQHVAAYGGEALPLKYRFAATWAAREGPLLMWLGWMALLAWWWRQPLEGEATDEGRAHTLRLRLVHGISLTLLLVAFSLDPFRATPPFFPTAGLNPLLQTDLMVIHPPLIFLTYAYCLHLAAAGLASLYAEELDQLPSRLLRVARPGLVMATLGIGLGGLWAYLILDWGGYWAWDPVETGSFLPWLALVMVVHLRTRPGKVSETVWVGGALAAALFAIFATTVTRAGGVWASSVHTFVTSDGGTPPDDVFGRLMVIRNDAAATEVMTYVVLMLTLVGAWLVLQRRHVSSMPLTPRDAVWLSMPVWSALLGGLLLSQGTLSWARVPQWVFLLAAVIPLLALRRSSLALREEARAGESERLAVEVDEIGDDNDMPWSYANLTPVPLDAVFTVVVYALTGDVLVAVALLVLFLPLYRAPDALEAWPWAAAGVMLGLSLAWSQLVPLTVAGLMLLMFVTPWLLAPQSEGSGMAITVRRNQQRIALWGSVVLVSLYLVLTWVLLVSSIDAVHFDAHELYGAPFLAGLSASFFVYTRRNDDPRHTLGFLGAVGIISVGGMVLFPTAFGMDAGSSVSTNLTRGHIVWLSLPVTLLAVAPMAREVVRQGQRASATAWRRIPLGAHVVHLGLLLLLLGHLSTTVLVDRGDASHRVSLVKDEVIVHEGFGLEFQSIVLESEALEVGDGFVGVRINVYEMDGNEVGDLIGEVMPGTLRFDRQGVPRSEVDTLTRLTGDIVFIFDGSQAGALMATAQSEGLDGVQLVRVTVYDLPHSHLVWFGWVTMMVGMAWVVVAGGSLSSVPPSDSSVKAEEE